MASWTNPKTWAFRDALTPALFNSHVRDNSLWLYERPYEFKYTDGGSDATDAADYSAAGSGKKTLYTFTQFTLTESSVLQTQLNAAFAFAAANRTIYMDTFITPSVGSAVYASNGLTTKPTSVWSKVANAGIIVNTDFSQRVTLAAGTYTISIVLFYSATAATITWYQNTLREQALLRLLY